MSQEQRGGPLEHFGLEENHLLCLKFKTFLLVAGNFFLLCWKLQGDYVISGENIVYPLSKLMVVVVVGR